MSFSRRWFVSLLMFCIAVWGGDVLAESQRTQNASGGSRSQFCRKHLDRHLGTSRDEVVKGLEEEVRAYRPLVDEMLALRVETIEAAEQLKRQIRERKKGVVIQDVERFNRASLGHLNLRKRFHSVMEGHDCWIDVADYDLEKLNLTDAARLKGVMLSLSASLVLYDNYLLSVALHEQDPRFRKALRRIGSDFDRARAEGVLLTLEYGNEENRREAVEVLSFYKNAKKNAALDIQQDPQMIYLEQLISQSPSYRSAGDSDSRPIFGKELELFGAATHDALVSLQAQNIDLFTSLFAGPPGPLEIQGGNRPKPAEGAVKSKTKPKPKLKAKPKKAKPIPKAKAKTKRKPAQKRKR